MNRNNSEQEILHSVFKRFYGDVEPNNLKIHNLLKDFEHQSISYSDVMQELNIEYPSFVAHHVKQNYDMKETIARNLLSWMVDASQWLKDPNNAKKSYLFIDSHPRSWEFKFRGENKKKFSYSDPKELFNPFDYAEIVEIEFAGAAENVIDAVSIDPKGKPIVMLETGINETTRERGYMHDVYLDIYAPSFGNSYVQLAHRIFYLYDILGVLRTEDSHKEYFEEFKVWQAELAD